MDFIKPYLNLFSLAIMLALVSAGILGVRAYNNSLRDQGREEIRAEWQASINTALIERNREISRLITVNKGIQDELNAVEVAVADLARDRARALSLRDKAARNSAIANAATGALRDHAARAEDDLDRSQEDVERFGLEAVRASSAAHALNATLRARREDIDNYRATLRNPSTTGETQ